MQNSPNMLTPDQVAAACELVDTRKFASGDATETIIDALCCGELAGFIEPQLLAAEYNAWKRKQRILEDYGDPDEQSSATLDERIAESASDPASVVQQILGRLMDYMGEGMVRNKVKMKRSHRVLRHGETAKGVKGAGAYDGIHWTVAAVVIERHDSVVKVYPECQYICTSGGWAHFNRLAFDGTQADTKRITSKWASLLWLYQNKGSLRELAGLLGGVTAANLSFHARNMAEKAIKPGGHANFPNLKGVEKLKPVAAA